MSAYYNEYDPFAAAWLRNLIAEHLIAPGDVDERSITEVRAADLAGYTQCHFFAGIGGWSYALRLAGWPDDRPVWTGSCPCQPFSGAGRNQGTKDPRHLWPAWFPLIRECRPDVVFGEQVEAAIKHGWLDLICADLEGEDYGIGPVGLPAACVGAPQMGPRLYWVAASNTTRRDRVAQPNQQQASGITSPRRDHLDRRGSTAWASAVFVDGADGSRCLCPPGIPRMVDGLSEGMGRLRGYGNAIVPQVAAEVIAAYMEMVDSLVQTEMTL